MLLCDGCDRGHHTYCLRPKVKVCSLYFKNKKTVYLFSTIFKLKFFNMANLSQIIPDDDWFCPECRPKQRFRRTVARQRPSLESEEEEEEEDWAELNKMMEMQSEDDENEATEENETEEEIEMENRYFQLLSLKTFFLDTILLLAFGAVINVVC